MTPPSLFPADELASPTRSVLTTSRRVGRWVELIGLFFLAPGALAWAIHAGVLSARGLVFPAIWGLGLVALALLLLDKTFCRRELWNWAGVRAVWPGVVVRFLLSALALTVLLALLRPELMLRLPRERPEIWVMVMLGYPIVSVYAQEIAFRTLYFHRYAPLFRSTRLMLAVNAVLFGWAHVIMLNGYAVGFSIAGGLLFAWTYHRSRSTAAVCLEHALYGCFVFTIGWGSFFFGGAVRAG